MRSVQRSGPVGPLKGYVCLEIMNAGHPSEALRPSQEPTVVYYQGKVEGNF